MRLSRNRAVKNRWVIGGFALAALLCLLSHYWGRHGCSPARRRPHIPNVHKEQLAAYAGTPWVQKRERQITKRGPTELRQQVVMVRNKRTAAANLNFPYGCLDKREQLSLRRKLFLRKEIRIEQATVSTIDSTAQQRFPEY